MAGQGMLIPVGMVAVGMGVDIRFPPAVQDPGAESGAVVGIAVAVGVAGLNEENGEAIDVEFWGMLSGESPVFIGGRPIRGRHSLVLALFQRRSVVSRPGAPRPLGESRFGLCPLFVFRGCHTVGCDTEVVGINVFDDIGFPCWGGVAGLPTHVAAGGLCRLGVSFNRVEAGPRAAPRAAALLTADQTKFGKSVEGADHPTATDLQPGSQGSLRWVTGAVAAHVEG
jgi:hypothetical protein